jgi:hypothetical protein
VTDTEHVTDNGIEIGTVDTDHELVQCDGCQSISYREFWCTSNEDPDYIPVSPERQRLFPPRLQGRRRIAFKLPDEIEAIYAETYRALCDGSPILAGIGIRAIVEAACRKKGAKTGNLENKIDKLVASRGALQARRQGAPPAPRPRKQGRAQGEAAGLSKPRRGDERSRAPAQADLLRGRRRRA